MSTGAWWPILTRQLRYGQRPEPCQVIAFAHAVWTVARVVDTEFDVDDELLWLEHEQPDRDQWVRRPYTVHLRHIGGVRPPWYVPGTTPTAKITVRAQSGFHIWHIYPEPGRWPQCSCCGEPMPCRADLADRITATCADRMEELLARIPGACWNCQEPITSRQKSVTYRGDNLDLPGGPQVRFHSRQDCWPAAADYELRWLADDPSRQRILTWPDCHGWLRVHADGTSDCQIADGHRREPDCRGHLTHDHMSRFACAGEGDCTRGCRTAAHRGIRLTPRTPRDQETS